MSEIPMIDESAQGLAEIIERVRSIARRWNPPPLKPEELWFRGQSKACYELLPGLYRPEKAVFNYDEENLFERFKVRGTPYIDEKIKTEWDWYFLAQHHGLPTRLLDWTENLLAAVYFAIAKYLETGDRREYDVQLVTPPAAPVYDLDSPTVWILDAGSLNQFACGPSEDYVITTGGELTNHYLPTNVLNKSPANRYPLAILPPQTNPRIVAQQGVFTVHGHDRQSIDHLAASSSEVIIKLARIKLDRANLSRLWEELELTGVNKMTLFPDLDAIAYCTKWSAQNA